VHSAVVHLERLETPRYPANAHNLNKTVATAFNQRRKMLRASLRGLAPDVESLIVSAGIKPTARAEELSVEEFCTLSRTLFPN
jgi:16S rRNA (adenine1518-N6/adenine1519-N6)-dimethyltransferase